MTSQDVVYEISGIEFGTFDENQKQRIKAVVVSESVINDRSGEPMQHGVMSRYMGTFGNFFCNTCHNTADKCSGHHGLIEFARPVYQPLLFHKPLIKVLSSLCFFCSTPLMDAVSRGASATANPRRRGSRVFQDFIRTCTKKLKKGFVCANAECGATVQPKYTRAGQGISVSWPKDHQFASEEERAFCQAPFTATHAREIFLNVDPTVVSDNMKIQGNLADMFTPISTLVLPVQMRPSIVIKNKLQVDATTKHLADIVRFNEQVKKFDANAAKFAHELAKLDETSTPHSDTSENSETSEISEIDSASAAKDTAAQTTTSECAAAMPRETVAVKRARQTQQKARQQQRRRPRQQPTKDALKQMSPIKALQAQLKHAQVAGEEAYQRMVRAFNIHVTSDKSNGTEAAFRKQRVNHVNAAKSLRDMIKGKHGLIRRHMLSCRIHNSARMVLAPDPTLPLDHVRVPFTVAKKLSVPERVTDTNVQFLRECVARGENEDFGARAIELGPDDVISLRGLSSAQRRALVDQVRVGVVVHRCLHTGDTVLFNRQPTIHKYGMISVNVIVDKKNARPNYTLRIPPAMCGPTGADFDGDEANINIPQKPDVRAESHTLAQPEANMMNNIKCIPTFGLGQDVVIGASLLTEATRRLTVEQFSDLLCQIRDSPQGDSVVARFSAQHEQTNKRVDLTGRQLVEFMFPLSLQYHACGVHIRDGKFEPHSECLAKPHLSSVPQSIVTILIKDFDARTAKNFLSDMSRVAMAFLTSMRCVSMGLEDVTIDAASRAAFELKNRAAREKHAKATSVVEQMMAMGTLSKVSRNITDASVSHLRDFNGFREFIGCGARGSSRNTAHMNLCIGQQMLVDEFMQRGNDGRTMAAFGFDERSPESDGWVGSSFRKGLNPAELFIAADAGRAGVAATWCDTADIGYTYRRLYRIMNSITLQHDSTARTAEGRVVLFQYFDGMNPEYQERVDASRTLFRQFSGCNGAQPTATTTWLDETTERLRCVLVHCRRSVSPTSPDGHLWVPANWQRMLRDADSTCNGGNDDTDDDDDNIDAAHVQRFFAELDSMNNFNLLQLKFHIASTLQQHWPMRRKTFESMAKKTLTFIPRCTAWAGTPVGSSAAELTESCTQGALRTFHKAGEANETVKDRLRKLLLLTLNNKQTVNVHIQPYGKAVFDERATQRMCDDLVFFQLNDIVDSIKRVAEPLHNLPNFARASRLHCELKDCVENGVTVWQLRVNPDKLRASQTTFPWIVRVMRDALPSSSCVWTTSMCDPAPSLFVAADASVDFQNVLALRIAGHPDVISASCEPLPLSISDDGCRRFAVCAQVRSVRPILACTHLDAATMYVDCPLAAASLWGIEAAQSVLADRLKATICGENGHVHTHHLRLVAAFLCMTGRVSKLDRFDVSKYSTDVLGIAAFETPTVVMQRAAMHGEATDDVSRSVNSATILNVAPRVGSGLVDVIVPNDNIRARTLRKRSANALSNTAGVGRSQSSRRELVLAAKELARRNATIKGPDDSRETFPEVMSRQRQHNQVFAWNMSLPSSVHIARFHTFARAWKRKRFVHQKKKLSLVADRIASTSNLQYIDHEFSVTDSPALPTSVAECATTPTTTPQPQPVQAHAASRWRKRSRF